MILMTTNADGKIQVKNVSVKTSEMGQIVKFGVNWVFPLSLAYLPHAMLADTAGGIGGLIFSSMDYFCQN